MSAIAFELPPEIRETCDGLTTFVPAEIAVSSSESRTKLQGVSQSALSHTIREANGSIDQLIASLTAADPEV